MDQNTLERRRVPRLQLTVEQFRLESSGKIFSVQDLSTSGMAIRVIEPTDLIYFTIGSAFKGTLKLRNRKIPLECVSRNVRPDLIGIEFKNLSPETRQTLDSFFDPEVLGALMKPIPSPDGRAIWYHGGSGTDLLIWRGSDGMRIRVGLYILGSFIQWDEENGLRTGRAQAGEDPTESRGVIGFETLLLEPDSVPDPAKVNLARKLLGTLQFGDDTKDWCLRKLKIEA